MSTDSTDDLVGGDGVAVYYCPGCNREIAERPDPLCLGDVNRQPRAQWEATGCTKCYAIWKCSEAMERELGVCSDDIVFLEPDREIEIRLYNSLDATDPYPGFGKAREVAKLAGADAVLDLAREWLDSCVRHHSPCHDPTHPVLPTRLLDISSDIPRLVNTKGAMEGPYAALSHCWGPTQPLRTLRTNIARHEQGILPAWLPPTFRDAILVARRLGFQHLWIDSLCIIQDDGEDWAREARSMAKVYSEANLVISASSSAGSQDGFLGPRPESMGGTVTFPSPFDPEGTSTIKYREVLFGDNRVLTNLVFGETDPVRMRGWCFQERLLARRFLSFGTWELVWECNSTCRCESYSQPDLEGTSTGNEPNTYREHGYNMSLPLSADAKTETLYDFWYENVVPHFTQRRLTRETDRLVAVEGIAQVLGRHLDDEYLFGIWKGRAFRGLCWAREWTEEPREAMDIVPSWSWASISGTISFMTPLPESTFKAEVIEIQPLDASAGERILSVVVRSKILSARLIPGDGASDVSEPTLLLSDHDSSHVSDETRAIEVSLRLDTAYKSVEVEDPNGGSCLTATRASSGNNEDIGVAVAVWLLYLGRDGRKSDRFIVLGRSKAQPGSYQRLGFCELESPGSRRAPDLVAPLLDELSMQEVSLV